MIALGYHSKRGGFSRKMVACILSNVFYIGTRIYPADYSKTGREEVVPDDHPAIIAKEIYEKVQERRKAMATVMKIPATIQRFTSAPIAVKAKRKVAAYARVSTDHEEQLTSYEAQVDYYTKYIQSRDDWEFADIYTDEGISATNTKKREGFKAMIADALAGKIDLIVTKSVSRFARNTVDSLSTIRQLKEHGVEVYFEKENIWTFDSRGELLITIMSSLAQEESRSISENVTWGQRKRMADGKVSVPFGRFLGYDRGENGELVVNPEQAEIVRHIYDMFLRGMSWSGLPKNLPRLVFKHPAERIHGYRQL